MLSNSQRLNLCYLKIIHIFHRRYHPKIIGHILKNKQKKNCKRVLSHEFTLLIITKIKIRKKKWIYGYDINRRRSRHGYYGHKYGKYKNCLRIIMLICIKQQLMNV